jgi:hypothetical protein
MTYVICQSIPYLSDAGIEKCPKLAKKRPTSHPRGHVPLLPSSSGSRLLHTE